MVKIEPKIGQIWKLGYNYYRIDKITNDKDEVVKWLGLTPYTTEQQITFLLTIVEINGSLIKDIGKDFSYLIGEPGYYWSLYKDTPIIPLKKEKIHRVNIIEVN